MTTIEQFKETELKGIEAFEKLEAENVSLDSFWETIKKYGSFGFKVFTILAKYFYKNGKIYAPSLLMIWKYFGLAGELYILFKDFNKDTK